MANDITRMLGASNYSYLFNNNSAKRQNSISSLWSNYGSFQSNAANNLAALTEVRQNSAAVIESYNEAKDTFYTGFDDAMSELKESAGKVKNLDFNVGENAITKTEVTDENGEVVKDENGNAITKTTYSETMQNALDTVKDFISDYNDALSFLKDHSPISSRIERTANNFADTTYRASIYESIGINVGSDGTLSIDEEKLANSIVNDPDKVSNVLGERGLASKAENHVDNANAQRDSLFPSAKTMLGKQLEQAEIYTGSGFIEMESVSEIGNLINMMF